MKRSKIVLLLLLVCLCTFVFVTIPATTALAGNEPPFTISGADYSDLNAIILRVLTTMERYSIGAPEVQVLCIGKIENGY